MLDQLLARATPPATDDLASWLAATADVRTRGQTSVDRALLAGTRADRLGFAFAVGYGEALRVLAGIEGVAALCATEAGGNRPRDIATKLEGRVVTGHKKWATVGSLASTLLVVATTGQDLEGKNRLRVVRVSAAAPGVTITPSTAAFIHEIPHAEITLDRVNVDEVLPGDGYDDYLKPFRTIEDIHVHAALVGYLIGVARRRELPGIDRLVAIAGATRELAGADVRAPATHVALAGVLALIGDTLPELEKQWGANPDDEWARWQRDRVLLHVAGAARKQRRERAWQKLG
jgi:hypothetical protein